MEKMGFVDPGLMWQNGAYLSWISLVTGLNRLGGVSWLKQLRPLVVLRSPRETTPLIMLATP